MPSEARFALLVERAHAGPLLALGHEIDAGRLSAMATNATSRFSRSISSSGFSAVRSFLAKRCQAPIRCRLTRERVRRFLPQR